MTTAPTEGRARPGHQAPPRQQTTLGKIEELWVRNGGNRGWAPLMAGVAIVESGGNPTAAYNTTTRLYGQTRTGNPGQKGATGLWQIEYPLWARAARVGTRTQLYTPTVNARTAIKAWNTGKGTSNWWTPRNASGQDALIGKWKRAGSPRYPSELQVITWLGELGLENKATGAGQGSVSPKLGAPTAAAGKGSNCGHPTPSDPTRPLCAIKLGPGLCLANYCQLQALKGGLLVTAGGVVMFVGLALLAAAGFGKAGPLTQLQGTARRMGIGGRGAQTGAQRRAQAEAEREKKRTLDKGDALEKRATPAQLRGEPEAGRIVESPFTDADQTPDLARRSTERRPGKGRAFTGRPLQRRKKVST